MRQNSWPGTTPEGLGTTISVSQGETLEPVRALCCGMCEARSRERMFTGSALRAGKSLRLCRKADRVLCALRAAPPRSPTPSSCRRVGARRLVLGHYPIRRQVPGRHPVAARAQRQRASGWRSGCWSPSSPRTICLWRLAAWVGNSTFVAVTGDVRRDLFRHLTGHAPSYFASPLPRHAHEPHHGDVQCVLHDREHAGVERASSLHGNGLRHRLRRPPSAGPWRQA